MNSSLFAALSLPTGSNMPMAMLLTKATIILLLALGMTVVMQRASAGARHLVWLASVAALLFVPALTAWGPLPFRVLPAVSSADRSATISGSKSLDANAIESDKVVLTAPSGEKVVASSDKGVSATISDSGLKTGVS